MPGASAVDVLLDAETHDLVVENGQLVVERDPGEVLAQRIRIRLRTWRGEWYRDPAFGVDYRGKVLVHSPQRSVVIAELRRVIEGTPGVKSIVSLEVEHEQATRTFRITRGIVDSDAGAVEISG